MSKGDKGKVCFVIAPIGEEGSEIRRRSDQVLKHIISPAAKDCGYETIRADKISEPGMITSQVIQHLLDDPLVIADLTGRNPNVFYELAVRHAIRKPIVQIIQTGEPIPFDVAQSRTILVDHRDLDSAAHCRDELAKQIRKVELDPIDVDTPISVAIDIQSLRQSENPLEKWSAEIMGMLQDIRSNVRGLGQGSRHSITNSAMLNDAMDTFDHLASMLDSMEEGKPSRDKIMQAQALLQRGQAALHIFTLEAGMPTRTHLERLSRPPLPPRSIPPRPLTQ